MTNFIEGKSFIFVNNLPADYQAPLNATDINSVCSRFYFKRFNSIIYLKGRANNFVYNMKLRKRSLMIKFPKASFYNTHCTKGIFSYRRFSADETSEERVLIHSSLNKKELNAYMREMFETYCTHEYDCCGHWYSTVMTHKTIKLPFGLYIVVIASYQNI